MGITLLLNCLITFSLLAIDTLKLSLDNALKIALEKSPSRIEAVLDSRTGTSKFTRGITQFLPTVTVQGSYGRATSPIPPYRETRRYWTGSIGLSQVVFDVDILGNLLQSKLNYDSYRMRAKDVINELVYNIKNGYFNLVKLYKLVEIGQSSLRRASDSYKLMAEKYRLGQISEIDLLRAEAFKAQSEIDLLTAEKNLKVANEDFKGQLGITEEVLIKPINELTEPAVLEFNDFETLWNQILKNNPGLVIGHKTEKIAQVGFFQSLLKILPEVSYYLQNSFSDTTFPKSLSHWQEKDATTYGLRFSFPIFELKSLVQNIFDANLEARRASVQKAKTELLLRKSVMSGFLSYNEAKERFNYAQKNLQLNQKLYGLAKEQFRLGSLTLLDLFDVEIKLAQAQASYITALAETYTNKALIDYLMGGNGNIKH